MSRDWDASRRRKDQYWAERIERLGPDEGFRIAGELHRQAKLSDPSWPSAAERDEDLAAIFACRTLSAVFMQPAAVEVLSALAPVLHRWGRWYLFVRFWISETRSRR